jgi:AcrR family transcriptional regulator
MKARGTEGPAARRRDPRHERNRTRLIDAAIAILLGDGMASFTSAHIAEAAGLHKPAFYAHFKNVDECLVAVAAHVSQASVRETLTLTASGKETELESRDWAKNIERGLRDVAENPTVYRVLMRYRFAENALGQAIRAMEARVRQHWVEFFWRIAVRAGVDAKHFREIAEMAEYIVSHTYSAGERVLTGRSTDIAAEAARVQRYNEAIISRELRRMLREK